MSAGIEERPDFSIDDSSRLIDTGLVASATRQGPPHSSTIMDSTSSKKPNDETDGKSVVRQYYETRGISKSAHSILARRY